MKALPLCLGNCSARLLCCFEAKVKLRLVVSRSVSLYWTWAVVMNKLVSIIFAAMLSLALCVGRVWRLTCIKALCLALIVLTAAVMLTL